MLNTPRQPHLHKADVSGSTDLTHGSLFSGIGGFELGAEWAGIPTIWNCEIEPFQRAVLKQRFKNTEQYEDIRKLTNPTKVNIISGGFPCQDISSAGGGAGIDGEKSGLWAEMYRICGEVRPEYIIIENSPNLTIRGFERVLCTFPKSGMMQNGNVYEVQTLGCPITETEFTVLPTICKQDGAGQVKSYLRTKETWESTSSLTCKMMAMQFGLQGNMPRPEGLFCINPKIAEMMMGYPNGWTELEV